MRICLGLKERTWTWICSTSSV